MGWGEPRRPRAPRPEGVHIGALVVLYYCGCGNYFTGHNLPEECGCGRSLQATLPVTAQVQSIGEQQAIRMGL